MAYVPPALRKRTQASSSPDGTTPGTTTAEEAVGSHDNPPPPPPPKSITAEPTFSLADIQAHYWHPPQDQEVSNSPGGTLPPQSSTLNASARDPDRLRYVLLFRGANPRWQSHGVIFVKSKLHILPGGERFKDEDPQAEVGRGGATPEQSDRYRHETRDGTHHESEDPTGEEGVLTSEVSSMETVPVEEVQTIEELQYPAGKHLGKERDEKRKPSGETEKKREKPTKPDPDPEAPYSPDLSLHPSTTIAVFEQAGGRASISNVNKAAARFRFAGHHRIASLEFLAPHSRELVQLLGQKFTTADRWGRGAVRPKQRSERSWKGSLRHRWAVVQMEKVEGGDDGSLLAPPDIEVRDRSGGGDVGHSSSGKSVDELLREMRVNS